MYNTCEYYNKKKCIKPIKRKLILNDSNIYELIFKYMHCYENCIQNSQQF